MKRIKETFIAIIAIAGLASCTSNDDVVEVINNERNPYFLDINAAIERSSVFLESASENATRSCDFAKVTSYQTVYDNAYSTRSNVESTPKFYIVNYGNSEGFSILSADSRMLPVYAFSDEGSLCLNDTIGNPALKEYMDGISGFDPQGLVIPPILPPENICGISVFPLLNKNVQKWNVTAPYNTYCPPLKDGIIPCVGCAPLTVAQIMSYFSNPTSFDGISLNWTNIINGTANDTLARLLAALGDPANMCTDYGHYYSYTDPSYVNRTLNKLGFTYNYIPFNEENVRQNLSNNQPVIAYSINHQWIIDGLYFENVKHYGEVDEPMITVTTYYYHCVWGTGGNGNGFFAISGNTIGGNPKETMNYETISYVNPYFLQYMWCDLSR